jgi:aryl-alcohol dehydrogenase-like predicted oxidoreductase
MPVGRREFCFPLRLGFGCSGPLAQPWFSPAKCADLIAAAFEGGVRHFDTAVFYAGGEAERRLGAAFRDIGESAFISTKAGSRQRLFAAPAKDFSETVIRMEVEASLRRLGRERVDLLYLHGPSCDVIDESRNLLDRLKSEGKIGLAGVCAHGRELDHAVDTEAVDVVMASYNLFDTRHAAAFARAREKGMGVVAIAPLAQGLYRKSLFAPRSAADAWHLARAFVKARGLLRQSRAASEELHGVEGWTPAQVALGFVHANPDIDVAITTTTRRRHLDESLDAARRTLPPEAHEAIERARAA